MAETHDIEQLYLVIEGRRITHVGESGLCELSPKSELVEEQVSADGVATKNKNRDNRLDLDILVMENSPAHEYLTKLYQEQHSDEGREFFSVTFRDRNKGVEIKEDEGYFRTRGVPNASATANEVTIGMTLPDSADDYTYTG
jgi:hypothetical protein